MSPRRTLATALKVLRQLRHDPRTVALILLVPLVLMIVLRYVFNDATAVFDRLAPLTLGVFPFVLMFILTSIAMLRERTTGTLERLMTLPISKLDILAGYALAFGLLAIIQAALVSLVTTHWLGVSVNAGEWLLLLVALLAGLLGMSLGLFASAFAKTEFQAVQFMPAFVLPQFLICGLFVPRDHMAQFLRWLSNIMPLTYAVDAMKHVALDTGWSSDLTADVCIMAGFVLAALILSAATLRRSH